MLDLSKKPGSMAFVLTENHTAIDNCKSVSELIETVSALFQTNSIDTKASRRLITNIKKQKSIESALLTVYNSLMAGSGMSVL